MGNLIRVDTPNGIINEEVDGEGYHYEYDHMDRLMSIKNPLGFVQRSLRDSKGNLIKRIDRNGNNQDRSYNIDGNITLLEAYKKDKENKLNVVRQQLEYNPDGTLSSAVFNNIEGLLKRKSVSGKTLLEYTYDKNNNLKTIQDENDNIQAQYEYFGNDNIKSVTLGNGVKTEYSYDGDGNVASLVTVTSSGEVLVDYNYAYDLNGNRLNKVSSKYKNYYSYDSMNRLVNSSYDNRKESFTYDKVGNRLTKTTNNITKKYVYNVKNQLKELHHKDGVSFFTYDRQGNTLKEETAQGTNSFEYNTLNQQVKAITKDGNTLVNRYDAEGLRDEIEENEKLSRFIFHNDEVLVETDENDNAVSRFIRGYDVVAADIQDNRYYYSVDEQGSTQFITDGTGKVRNKYRYDAFGNVLESREDIHNRITYTGQQFDNVTQQYYLRARFYNPVIGRFTQEDEYRGDGLNLYAYCENNPVIYYDPSGYRRATEIDSSKVNDQNVMNIISKYTKGTNILPTEQSDVEEFFDNMSNEEFRLYFLIEK